jgi:hypothetical protein
MANQGLGLIAVLLLFIAGLRVDVAIVHPSTHTWGNTWRKEGAASTGGVLLNQEGNTDVHVLVHSDQWTYNTVAADANGKTARPRVSDSTDFEQPRSAPLDIEVEPSYVARTTRESSLTYMPINRALRVAAVSHDLHAVAPPAIARGEVFLAGVPRFRAAAPSSPAPGRSLTPPSPFEHALVEGLKLQERGVPKSTWSGSPGLSGRIYYPPLRGSTSSTVIGASTGNIYGVSTGNVWPSLTSRTQGQGVAVGTVDPTRATWSCNSSRYIRSLNMVEWSRSEDDALRLGVALYGKNWMTILRNPHFSRVLQDRSVINLERRWNTLLAQLKQEQAVGERASPEPEPFSKESSGKVVQGSEESMRWQRSEETMPSRVSLHRSLGSLDRSLALRNARASEQSVASHGQADSKDARRNTRDAKIIERSNNITVKARRMNTGKVRAEEHFLILKGLRSRGWGYWSQIASDFVYTRTGDEVARHCGTFFFGISRPLPCAPVTSPNPL